MLQEAEKFASVDKEKRQNIDLKNQAEALCFEAEKELALLKKIFLKINKKILKIN
jgi:molecular chaperone DnaK (HSP70)